MTTALPTSAKAMASICTRDRARAKAFYVDTLGCALKSEDRFAAVLDMNGITLQLSTLKDFKPQPFTVLGWEVKNVEASVKALTAKGVTFQIYEGFGQNELGIWTAPDKSARVAWFTDTDGNILSLTQF